MKQRILNVFTRKLKNKTLANILTEIIYALLYIYYFLARISLLKKKNQLTLEDKIIEKAREDILKVRDKPNMDDDIINCKNGKDVDLSIIIPAYNVERYIEECLNSIVKQDIKYQCEVIIVNDGSTDSTEEKIKKIHDNRIKYISQKNKGLSGARNTGLNNAVGKYVMFVDSDDIVCDGSIEVMMDSIVNKDIDVVIGSYYMFTNKNDKQYCINEPQIIKNNVGDAVKNPGYAWGKVYKRELFNKIRFPLHAWYEDTLICSVIYRLAKNIAVIDFPVYGYRINPEGISRTARSSTKSIDHYWVMEHALELSDKNGLERDEVLYSIVFNHMSTFLYRRISLMPQTTIRATFFMACNMLNSIRPQDFEIDGNLMKRDLEKAFKSGNYKLWKLASFLI